MKSILILTIGLTVLFACNDKPEEKPIIDASFLGTFYVNNQSSYTLYFRSTFGNEIDTVKIESNGLTKIGEDWVFLDIPRPSIDIDTLRFYRYQNDSFLVSFYQHPTTDSIWNFNDTIAPVRYTITLTDSMLN